MSEQQALEAVARLVVPGARLLRSWPLGGGVSASMQALEIQDEDRGVRRVAVRRPGSADWKQVAADAAATEFGLLAALHRLGFAVPEPRFVDESGELLPSPYFVMELVEATTVVRAAELPEALRQMAAFLARLHALEVEEAELPLLPELEDPREAVVQYLPEDGLGERLRAALGGIAARPKRGRRALLHGDFWPGNILWRGGCIAAVVDWEGAALGDPLADVACCRVELQCRYDEAAVAAFTRHYRTLAKVDFEDLPLWDLYVSAAAAAEMANWGLAPAEEAERRRRTVAFMRRAGREWMSRSAGPRAPADA